MHTTRENLQQSLEHHASGARCSQFIQSNMETTACGSTLTVAASNPSNTCVRLHAASLQDHTDTQVHHYSEEVWSAFYTSLCCEAHVPVQQAVSCKQAAGNPAELGDVCHAEVVRQHMGLRQGTAAQRQLHNSPSIFLLLAISAQHHTQLIC